MSTNVTNQTIHTYADGFGRWHAVAPDMPDKLTRACDAMAEELLARGNGMTTLSEMRDYIDNSAVYLGRNEAGFHHYAEYAL
jgi:hypothetical protein